MLCYSVLVYMILRYLITLLEEFTSLASTRLPAPPRRPNNHHHYGAVAVDMGLRENI